MGRRRAERSSGPSCLTFAAVGCGVLLLGVAAVCGVGLVAGWFGLEQARKELAEANQLWDAGQKPDAVARYRQLLTKGVIADKSQEPVLYQRVIEYDVERGDTDSARQLADRAMEKNVDVRSGNEVVTKLLAEARADRERKAAEEAKRREEEKAARPKEGSQGVLKKGEVGYLSMNGLQEVWLPVDSTALKEMNSMSAARNEAGVRQLMQQGRVLVCDDRVKVTVIDPGLLSTTVRVMEGKHEGRTGVIASEFVHK